MTDVQATDEQREIARLRDEVEQLRTALEAAGDEVDTLVAERDRLLRRVTAQDRELQAANSAYSRATISQGQATEAGIAAQLRSDHYQEELRVAFEEMQVLTEELETANNSLHETNKALDERVEQRTRELEAKNLALRESEARLRTLAEGIPQLVWRARGEGYWTWSSSQWQSFTGQTLEESLGLGWLDPLHPDDRKAAVRAWAAASIEQPLDVEFRVRRGADGEFKWHRSRSVPVCDEAGSLLEWLGTSTDVHELRRLQESQEMLLAELQHRVRNILAVTRSIVRRSDDGERSTEDYVQHLEGRISALARTQVMLTRAVGVGVDLEDLVREELLAQVASAAQFHLEGPDVRLSPRAAEVLTLAIHELATNATKYGAFAQTSGRLRVARRMEDRDGEPWLVLDWAESRVAIIEPAPRRRGFGAELVSRRIPYELQGHGTFELRPGGLHSRIEFPLREGDSILQTDGVLQ